MEYTFVHETSNNQVKRLVALLILLLLVSVCIITAVVSYERAQGLPTTEPFLSRYTPDVMHDITPMKQFALGVIAGVVFIPIPVSAELAYYVGLQQGNPMFLSAVAAILGLVLGLAISYVVGLKLSQHIAYLVSTKHLYAIRRKVNEYGTYAILLIFFFPAPGDILSFSLGLANYNAKRLFFFMVIALVAKFAVVAAIFHYLH